MLHIILGGMVSMEENYKFLYEDGCLILYKGEDIFHMEYISELDLVEDKICELQEDGIIPCTDITRTYSI